MDNERDQQAAENHTEGERGSKTQKNSAALDDNARSKAKRVFMVLDAGVILLFWAYAEFFGGHGYSAAGAVCFYFFTVTTLAGIAYTLYSMLPYLKTIASFYIIGSLLAGILVYKVSSNRQDSRASVATSQPTTTYSISPVSMVVASSDDGEPPSHGVLTPASDSPPNDPNSPLSVFVGGSMAMTNLPTQPVLSIGGYNLLSINRTNKGVTVDAKIFDEAGVIVAMIVGNEWRVNPKSQGYFYHKRPDAHSLLVYDNRGNTVLNVTFRNPKTIQITGVFRYPGYLPVVVTDNAVLSAHMKASNNMYFGVRGPLFNFADPSPPPLPPQTRP